MRRALMVVVLTGVALAHESGGSDAPAVVPAAALPPDSTVQSLIDARNKLMPSSGIVIGLIDAQGRRVLAAGTLNGKGTPAPDGRSVFEIGSTTKTFTATLLADMVRRGEVRMEQPVAELLPSDVQMPARNGKAITLLDLSTQSSGLPRLPSNLAPKDRANPYADYSAEQLYSFLSSDSLERDPGAQYEYSNLGVGLLGFALARKSGVSYEAAVRARIAEPLGMEDTRVVLDDSQRSRLAPGHDGEGKTVPNWDFAALAGAGALRSTVNDMLSYVAMFLEADTTTDLGQDAWMATIPRRPTTIPDMRIGLNWHVREKNGTRIVWHNGGTGGYHAFVGFDRDHRTGIVILANSVISTDDIGFHLLDPSAPITPPTNPSLRKAITLKPEQLQPYVGRYELAPGAIMTVTLEKDQLSIQLGGQQALPIFPESDGHFFLEVANVTLDFERDDQKKVVVVTLHQGGQNMRGTRIEGATSP